MRIAPAILIMSMSKPPPHLLVRKKLVLMVLIIMRKKKKKKWRSRLSPRQFYNLVLRQGTIPLETYFEPQVSSFQCLEVPFYVEIFKESHTKDHKSRNRVPKWIPRNKVNYIRWRNILPEGYQILKKKGWKGLVGHPYERGRRSFVTFYFPHFIFF
jgi:hypothetical protein